MTLQTVFEKETCGRCGGSGHYSYNAFNGTTCFGCGGRKERLTKRGQAASVFYVESCRIPYAEVVVGDTVSFAGITLGGTPFARKGKVERIEHGVQKYKSGNDTEWREAPFICLWRTTPSGQEGTSGSPDHMIRKYWPQEVNDAKIAAALEYQATLTKMGKPMKSRVSA